ncbi:MAG: NAD-dependent epimerase/dehydratase family protein [Kofleriaceae bacterium]
MTIDRRRFVLGTLAGAAVAACGSRDQRRVAAPTPAPPPPPLRILVLGGTGFLGPHVVEAALARGHTLTLFNRGKTHAERFPQLEKLLGDRDGKLDALKGRSWDAVVDTSGYVPRVVKASAELLAPQVGHYVFISTVSVYAREDVVGADESGELATMPDPASEDVPQFYGALKARCEQAAEQAMPGRVTNIRPGLIVGPLDPTGRFTHWVTRTAAGGEVLAPGPGATLTQWIDGRDLGAWIIRVIETKAMGVMDALGPPGGGTIRSVIEACNHAGGDRATVTWVDPAFLEAHQVAPWQDLPMWVPAEGEYAGFGTRPAARAVAAGLTFRPIADTAADTLAWVRGLPADAPAQQRSSGIDPAREAAVLAAWKAR